MEVLFLYIQLDAEFYPCRSFLQTTRYEERTRMTFRRLILLIGLLIVTFSSQELQAQRKPEFSNYEYYVTDDGTFAL